MTKKSKSTGINKKVKHCLIIKEGGVVIAFKKEFDPQRKKDRELLEKGEYNCIYTNNPRNLNELALCLVDKNPHLYVRLEYLKNFIEQRFWKIDSLNHSK